ncbi:MAG: TolC family protein [Proteobacteria bacterium]|nr:TolC family protein [Pseudomonadota bacterium]
MCSINRAWFRKIHLVFITGSFLWISVYETTAVAAENPGVALGVDWLVNEVVSLNVGLTAEQLRAKAKKQLISSAGALEDPRVTYSVAPFSIGDHIPSNFGNALGIRQTFQLSQSVPWPGKRSLRTDQMQATAEVAQFSVEQLRLNLVNQSRLLWAQWWYVNEALAANAEHMRLSAELRVVAETQYANGIGLQQDVLQVQAREVELQHQQIVLIQERRRLQAQINHLLNQEPTTVLGPPLGEPVIPELPGREVLERWLLESHPGLLSLEAETNVARLNLRLTEKEDYPDVQFNLGYNELWDASSQRLQVGVSLNIPLDFGKRTSRKAAAEYEYSSKRLDIVNKRSQLMSELESQLSRFDQTLHGVQLIEAELVSNLRQNVNATLANYQSGGGNFYSLIEAQAQLLDMELLLSSSYAEQFITISEINRLSGGQLWPQGVSE